MALLQAVEDRVNAGACPPDDTTRKNEDYVSMVGRSFLSLAIVVISASILFLSSLLVKGLFVGVLFSFTILLFLCSLLRDYLVPWGLPFAPLT